MSDPRATSFDVKCPCCQAVLTVDPQARAVLAHAPPPKAGPLGTLDRAMEALRGGQAQREARFQEAAQAEKNKTDLLGRKFAAGLRRAKDTPDPPPRPFDLD